MELVLVATKYLLLAPMSDLLSQAIDFTLRRTSLLSVLLQCSQHLIFAIYTAIQKRQTKTRLGIKKKEEKLSPLPVWIRKDCLVYSYMETNSWREQNGRNIDRSLAYTPLGRLFMSRPPTPAPNFTEGYPSCRSMMWARQGNLGYIWSI